MSSAKIVALATILLVSAASVAHADQQRRGRGRRDGGRVVVRPSVVVAPPVVGHRGVARRGYYGSVRPYRSYSRGWYAPVHRPGLGIGIYIGSPRYYAPYRRYSFAPPGYGYAAPIFGYSYTGYPYVSPYPAYGGAIYAAPPANAYYGGVRLDVEPNDAAVHVDGYYAGIVDDFDGAWQRVALAPGPHRFEIVAPGYEPVTFDVNVLPNQTVRYRADLRPLVP